MGAAYKFFAPDLAFQASDPITDKPLPETRNIMHEAARIARGEISPLADLRTTDFDGLVIPGGFGVAKNLSTWAQQGSQCAVNADVERILNEFYMAEKPIAAICIAPALVAKVLGAEGVSLTIGNDPEAAAEINKTGAHHITCAVDDFVTDREHRIISTPAYMYGEAKPHLIYSGIRKAISELVEMA